MKKNFLKKLTSLQKLDNVLGVLYVYNPDFLTSEAIVDILIEKDNINIQPKIMYGNSLDPTYPDINKILMKLVTDDFAEKQSTLDNNFNNENDLDNSTYSITYDGQVFLEQGGYSIKTEKEKSDIELNRTIQYVISSVGVISAIYYISEMLKSSIGSYQLMTLPLIFMLTAGLKRRNIIKFASTEDIAIFIATIICIMVVIKVIVSSF